MKTKVYESTLRAKRKYRQTHPEETKAYNRWYYLNVTKFKRQQAKTSSNHQVS